MAKEIYNKNAREAHLLAEAYQGVVNESRMHTFGNVQFEPIGKDANNAEAFRVYKDGSYVLYATMFGPRQTVTFYTDPKDQAGPDTPLAEFNLQQVPGGIEQAAAAIGAAEDAEISGDGWSARDIPPDVAGKIAKQQADDASDAAAEEQRQRRLHAPSPADKFGRE